MEESEIISRLIAEVGRLSVEVERLKKENNFVRKATNYEIKLISTTFGVRFERIKPRKKFLRLKMDK
jgi:hypothetical protein